MAEDSDEIGKIYGRLTVIQIAPHRVTATGRWARVVCRCECGATREFSRAALRIGKTQSCGCLHKEMTSLASRTHGASVDNVPEYHVWEQMKRRCYWKGHNRYHRYGGRGIRVCKRWREDFSEFMDDMGQRPDDDHSIDRKKTDGNYSCGKCEECIANGWEENCKWATAEEQCNNRSSNVFLEFYGKRMTLSQWAKVSLVPAQVISGRIKSLGWDPKRAVWQPIKKPKKKKAVE